MEEIDLVVYAGYVSVQGYLALSEQIESQKTSGARSVFFVPITVGGDPNAGYRIARALGHYYPDNVRIGIPSICKSAGTLMCIGGSELVVADRGELGPLDIQLNSKDEIMGMSSGLDILQTLTVLQDTMYSAFKSYLYDLKFGGRLGSKMASDIASHMAIGLVSPIAQQIDPVKLGEHQRAMNIAIAYGERLNAKFKNTSRDKIDRLLTDYPAHGFVIDRKEISELFTRVRSPNEDESAVFDLLFREFFTNYGLDVAGNQPARTLVLNLSNLLNHIKNSQPESGVESQNVATESPSGDLDNNETTGASEPGNAD